MREYFEGATPKCARRKYATAKQVAPLLEMVARQGFQPRSFWASADGSFGFSERDAPLASAETTELELQAWEQSHARQ